MRSALACLAEARRLAARPCARWPGWDFDAQPVAMGVLEGTVLWNHPAHPKGFTAVREAAAPPGPVHLGPPLEGLANSAVLLGGVVTATARLEDAEPGPGAALLLVHEAFHAFQHRVRPGSGVPAHRTPYYPEDDAANNALARAENRALAAFLDGAIDPASCARDAAALRVVRYACIAEEWRAYEAAAEWCEGGAQLAETLAGGRGRRPVLAAALRRHNIGGSGAAYLRFYASGAAIGLLVAALLPAWRARWLAEGAAPADLLREAAGVGAEGADDALARWDVVGLLAEEARATRARRAEDAALLGGLSPAVVVDVSAAPATAFGFDPTRRRVLSGGRVWHGGWTRLEGEGWVLEAAAGPVLEDRAAMCLTVRATQGFSPEERRGPLHLPFLRAAAACVRRDGDGWRIAIERSAG